MVTLSFVMTMFPVGIAAAEQSPTVVELNCSNDAGDSSYFDNNYCYALVESKYKVNFNAVENSNHIELYRLDHMNPKHKNYIYLEKTTDEECYIEVSTKNRMSYTHNANKRYDYYLIEADMRSSVLGAAADMFLIRDSSTTSGKNIDYVTSAVDGSGNITDSKGSNIGKIIRGEWFNYKFAIDFPNKKADIYIDDVLVKTVTLTEFNYLDKVIFRLRSGEGTGNMFIDDFSVLGLVEPFKNGIDTMTDVFSDPPEVEQFLEGKVAFHGYGGIYYKNGERTHLDNFSYDKDTVSMYVTADDLEAAFDLKSDITVTDDGVTYGGKAYTLGKKPIQKDGEMLVSVEDFSKQVLSKYVFSFHTGFFIAGDENEVLDTSDWQYGSFRKVIDRYTQLNDIDFLNGFLTYDRPEGDKLREDLENNLGDLESAHPRILLNKSQFEHLAYLYQTDENYKYIANRIIATADSYLRQPVIAYEFDDTMRMCVMAGKVQSRFMAWGYAYQITKDQKYVDRAVKEFENLASFPDFNVIHMIDSGMAAMGLGCGYDWMYEGMTEEQRALARYVTYEICLKDVMTAYYGRMPSITSGDGTVRWMSNFNSVVTGGTLIGAVAVLEEDPDVLFDLTAQCIRSLEYAEMGFMPGGGWNEALGYCNYAMEFINYSLSTLDTAFGTCYGLKTSQGMESAVEFAMSAIGVDGINSYHDAGNSTGNSFKTFMYLANAYKKYDAYAMRHYDIFERNGKRICLKFDTTGSNPSVFAMDAKPLDTSPQVPEQNENAGIRKVAIKFNASGATDFTVSISGMENADKPIKNQPMISWTVDDTGIDGETVVKQLAHYEELKTVANCETASVSGLYGAESNDTAMRISNSGADIVSVQYENTDMPFTIFSANVSGRAFDYGICDGNGNVLNAELNHIDGWNNISVIRRNSDGKYITAYNGVYGEWQKGFEQTNAFNIKADIDDGGYVDIDNIKVYHSSDVPMFDSPNILNVQTDGGFVLSEGEKVSQIGGDFARAYKDNTFTSQLVENDVLTDGNIIVAYNDGIYKYYTVTTSQKIDDPSLVVNRDDNYTNFTMVRTNVKVVDDISGNYGKCVQLTGTNHSETSIYLETAYMNNYDKVYASVDVYPTPSLKNVFFATSGHASIGPHIPVGKLKQGQWNRIEIQIDTATGKGDVYINGVFYGSSVRNNISVLRIVFLRSDSTTNLDQLNVYADNFRVHASDNATGNITLKNCTVSGYEISGANGMTVSDFINNCQFPTYKHTVKVYSGDRQLYANESIKSGYTIRYYFGDVLVNWYKVK